MNELTCFKNLIHSISVPDLIQETDIDELRESIYMIIDDFISNNIHEYCCKDFAHRLFEHTYHIVEILYDDIKHMLDINITELIDEGIYIYFEFVGIKRSETTKITTPKNKRPYSKILTHIKSKDTHEQGTPEWFQFRWNHITASSAWKALEENASKNQMILGKCQPINIAKFSSVNTTSAMHHGHKFEPLSVLIYEEMYDTEIGDYGCIENDDYPHLAASPDGINIKINNPRYGRALEIKNPTTRKITGIPKKDYWIQMQMQMECLNLDECDFLETAFKEYLTEEEFMADGKFNESATEKRKGVIACFNNGSHPIYKYAPLHIHTQDMYEIWMDDIVESSTTLTWVKNTYWYLETMSCVLVRRNKPWFEAIKHKFKDVWETILKERIEGFEHRKPKKRIKQSEHNLIIETLKPPDISCLKIDTESLKSFALEI